MSSLSGAPLHDEETLEVVEVPSALLSDITDVSAEKKDTDTDTDTETDVSEKKKVKETGKADVFVEKPNGWKLLTSLTYFAITVFSLYLAYACNKKFDLIHIIVAFLCPVCYIPYGLYCILRK